MFQPAHAPWPSRMLSIFRIVAGLIFLTTGTMKIFNYPPNPVPGMSDIELFSQIGIGGILEIVGGILIVLGLFTRPTSFVLAGMMAVAYFQFHQPNNFWPTVNGGVPAIMYCFFFLYLMVAGPGIWSADTILARRAKR
jgi:putative oxidoreductase